MKLTPEELPQHGYTLLYKLELTNLMPFVRTYLSKRNFFVVFYFASIITSFLLMIFCLGVFHKREHLGLNPALLHCFYGFIITFVLIPLHEGIHVLVFRLQGAKQTTVIPYWKRLTFLAIADKFVVSKTEFLMVALAPFVVISAALTIGAFYVSHPWVFTILGILFTHTIICGGDFALVSYFAANKDKTIVTYDDLASKVSYFYSKPGY